MHSDIFEFVVKIIEADNLRGMENDFMKVKRAKVDGLMKREIWKKISKSEAPANAITLGGRFVMALKNYYTPSKAAKA